MYFLILAFLVERTGTYTEYGYLIVNYLVILMCSLQSWIFCMKYLDSALICSLTKPCVSQKFIKNSLWIGIFSQIVALTVLWLVLMITYPGRNNLNYNTCYSGTFTYIFSVMSYIWLFFTLLSTFLTIYAIKKIFKTVQELQKNNATVKINRRAMTIHCLVLIVNSIVVLLQCLPIS